MPPLTHSYPGGDLALSATPVDSAVLTLTGSATADTYWFVVGVLSYTRATGTAPIRVEALFSYPSPFLGTTLAYTEYGGVKGISIADGGVVSAPIIPIDSVTIMKAVKVIKGKLALQVYLQGKASAAGISLVGQSSQSGQKVTTLTAFQVK